MDRITSPRVTFGKFIIVDKPDPAHNFFLSLPPARGRPPALRPHSVSISYLFILFFSPFPFHPFFSPFPFPFFFSYHFLCSVSPSPTITLPSRPSPPYFIPIPRLSIFPPRHTHTQNLRRLYSLFSPSFSPFSSPPSLLPPFLSALHTFLLSPTP